MSPSPAPLPAAPHVVIAVGDVAAAVAEDLCRDGDRCTVLPDADGAGGPAVGPVLDAELRAVTTGWRVLAVGAERDVHAVRAAALARGALDEEVTVVALDVAPDDVAGARVRAVRCGVCHHRSDVRAAVGDAVHCARCHAELVVTDHLSRVHGAVLGLPR